MGGRSSEHDISVASARSVVDALDPERYDVRAVEIGQDGRWQLNAPAEQAQLGEGGPNLPVPADGSASPFEGVDVVFPVLHGPFGEDGTVQGFLELADVAYVGAGVTASALCMVLSDRTIRRLLEEGRIGIDPYSEDLLQPSSVDVRVDRLFRVFRNSRYPYIDVKEPMEDLTELVEVADVEPFILHPGEFVLGSTLERVTLPDDLVARLEGKSSLGRLGLLIHSTAGFIDPGFDGHITLELSNVDPRTNSPGCRMNGSSGFVSIRWVRSG